MSEWSITELFGSLHKEVERQLSAARTSLGHQPTKGTASENIWLELLRKYLPQRYQAENAHVVDSEGMFSDQIDIVVFDRQYSPFMFTFHDQLVVPAESVYAAFEAKQSLNADNITKAHDKVESVRKLHRTSLPIPHAGGTFPAKPLIPVIGGIVTLESDWNPKFGDALSTALKSKSINRLDLGCVAVHGCFEWDDKKSDYEYREEEKAATSFLFTLISRLQFSGTVPMIDIQSYARWLK